MYIVCSIYILVRRQEEMEEQHFRPPNFPPPPRWTKLRIYSQRDENHLFVLSWNFYAQYTHKQFLRQTFKKIRNSTNFWRNSHFCKMLKLFFEQSLSFEAGKSWWKEYIATSLYRENKNRKTWKITFRNMIRVRIQNATKSGSDIIFFLISTKRQNNITFFL